ncbi:MAG: S8 family serine peptidase [Nitrospirae bacterium]|nr:S8 family serine peptidase [Nitrospirota bacterium]MBF0590465.1 S8 family serine peptidase [Nitrospirota bacterium]
MATGQDGQLVYWYEGDVKRHAWQGCQGQYAVLPEGTDYTSHVYYTDRGMKTKMALSGEVIVRYATHYTQGQVAAIEEQFGLRRKSVLPLAQDNSRVYVYEATDGPIGDPIDLANAIRESAPVIYSYPNWLRHVSHRAISNDAVSVPSPKDTATPNDPLFPQQWHLKNTGQGGGLPGADINVSGLWDTYRATPSQTIAVVDNGLEIGHEDLKDNVLPNKSYNYLNKTTDPTPTSKDDYHGTSCAGVAAARGFNAIGVTGVAPAAGLVGYNLLMNFTDDNGFDAMTRGWDEGRIYTNSWGPDDTGDILEAPAPSFVDALSFGTSKGRGGLGNIYTWAGGNGKTNNDNSNDDGYANSRYVFAIGASTNMGTQAYYSEDGANILVNAPSSGGTLGITTTTLTDNGKYKTDFSGTSAVAPMAAGAVAIILEANPALSWRDVRYILASSARKNDPSDSEWTINGAGLHVNHKYGFGTIDVSEAVNQAKTWSPLPPETSITKTSILNKPIPDNNSVGIDDTISVSEAQNMQNDLPGDFIVEFVEVYLNAPDHPCFADLDVTLTSPSGTQSVLAKAHSITCPSEYAFDNWRFGSTRHLGEPATGNWTLHVADRMAGNTGTLKSWGIKLYGHSKGLIPKVMVNGKSLQTTASSTDNIAITVSLAAGQFTGKNADWWLYAVGPNGVSYHFSAATWAWVSGTGVSYQGQLFSLPTSNVFNGGGLPPGSYTVTFGVDLTPDGVVDTNFFVSNSVDFTVTP